MLGHLKMKVMVRWAGGGRAGGGQRPGHVHLMYMPWFLVGMPMWLPTSNMTICFLIVHPNHVKIKLPKNSWSVQYTQCILFIMTIHFLKALINTLKSWIHTNYGSTDVASPHLRLWKCCINLVLLSKHRKSRISKDFKQCLRLTVFI